VNKGKYTSSSSSSSSFFVLGTGGGGASSYNSSPLTIVSLSIYLLSHINLSVYQSISLLSVKLLIIVVFQTKGSRVRSASHSLIHNQMNPPPTTKPSMLYDYTSGVTGYLSDDCTPRSTRYDLLLITQ
jgi:hypothetical protein